MYCQKCGCHHPPFAVGENASFDPDCRCNCHGAQITYQDTTYTTPITTS
jgi:hypothetical protein